MYDNPPSVDQRTVCALTDASVKGGTWVLLGIDWTWLRSTSSPDVTNYGKYVMTSKGM